jgi:hypothetical protein
LEVLLVAAEVLVAAVDARALIFVNDHRNRSATPKTAKKCFWSIPMPRRFIAKAIFLDFQKGSNKEAKDSRAGGRRRRRGASR